jgi:hypothetical protein
MSASTTAAAATTTTSTMLRAIQNPDTSAHFYSPDIFEEQISICKRKLHHDDCTSKYDDLRTCRQEKFALGLANDTSNSP